MKKEIDDLLKQALTPSDEPDFRVNREILNQVKETNQMGKRRNKRIPAAALACALVLTLGSVTAYAAWKYLAPEEVAEKMQDQKLKEAFLSDEAITVNETQSYGGYDITLLSIVSGKTISESLITANGKVEEDRTYSVVAIQKTDGTPMPDISEDAYGEASFLVSPFIQGYDPDLYNAVTMQGGYTDIVEKGVLYRLTECSNVEVFADKGLYLGVSDGVFYNPQAYRYDEATGTIARNTQYNGVNALFRLPADVSKADPAAAAEYIRRMQEPQKTEGESTPEEATETDRFVQQLTPENIEEYAQRVESTVLVLTPDKDGVMNIEYEVEGRGDGSMTVVKSDIFPEGKTGMDGNFSYGYSDEGLASLVIETYTLNEDGTVTFAIYIPKQ